MPNHYSTFGISFTLLVCSLAHVHTRHTQGSILSLHLVILNVTHCPSLQMANKKQQRESWDDYHQRMPPCLSLRAWNVSIMAHIATLLHSALDWWNSSLVYRWSALICSICHAGKRSSIILRSLIGITAVWEHNDLPRCLRKTGQGGIMTGEAAVGHGQRCATFTCA